MTEESMKGGARTRILFVCTGNICRSPTAQGVFERRASRAGLGHLAEVASAGTHGYHVGEPPDARAVAAAARRGYDLSVIRARCFERQDFERFDLVLAMDRANKAHLARLAKGTQGDKLCMALDFSSRFRSREVPDPYYGGPDGFDRVLDMLEDAADGLLESLGGR